MVIIKLISYNSKKMSYKYKYKKKSVHLEDSLHNELKNRADKKNTSIERVVNDILKKELKSEKNEKK